MAESKSAPDPNRPISRPTGTADPGARSLSERLAAGLSAIAEGDLSPKATLAVENEFIEVLGLMVAAGQSDYMAALFGSLDSSGPCTYPGYPSGLSPSGAALAGGVGIHGEDFDDTLEGAPIRVAAMVFPAVLAAGERHGRSGREVFLGAAAGMEAICRINRLAPGLIHSRGFHPVGVLGPFGSAAGVSRTLNLGPGAMAAAFGLAGSLSSGLLEYLAEGAWTKRLHPGLAARSGLEAATLASKGFVAPRFVFEGRHGLFHGFAGKDDPDPELALAGLGQKWYLEDVAFKPYPCGTMIHPYIDCMKELAKTGLQAADIVSIVSDTGAGFVPRLWEPLEAKRKPGSPYAAKFSVPWCMAMSFFTGSAGLGDFSEASLADENIAALCQKISYRIDPNSQYPDNYEGHVLATLTDGRQIELRQPHLRGGAKEPLTRDEIIAKFYQNLDYGNFPADRRERLLDFALTLPQAKNLSGYAYFRA